MILSVSDCERTKVQQGARVLDMKIAEIGKARGLEVVGLETIPAQLEALAAVPEQQQLDMLRASLKFADRTDDLMETLVQLYLSRKITAAMPFQIALAKEAGVSDQAFVGFQEKLLVERNEKMRAVAEPLLDKGGVFIAVGALHLPGEKGLVALLRKARLHASPPRVALRPLRAKRHSHVDRRACRRRGRLPSPPRSASDARGRCAPDPRPSRRTPSAPPARRSSPTRWRR